MQAERWRLPQGGEAPADMVFRVEPPAAIGGKERLWYVTAAPGEQKPDDPQFHFGEAVLRAFAAHQARRDGAAPAMGTT